MIVGSITATESSIRAIGDNRVDEVYSDKLSDFTSLIVWAIADANSSGVEVLSVVRFISLPIGGHMTDNNNSLINPLINPQLLEIATRELGLGSYNGGTAALLYGLNNQGGLPPLPPNHDNQGYVFYTMPDCNLSQDNTRGSRKLLFLDTPEDINSTGNLIRCLLSPYGYEPNSGDKFRSPRKDDKLPFIALLTNTTKSLTGWPDAVYNVYVSAEGIGKEQTAQIDARTDILNQFDLTGVFANIDGDLLTTLFSTWTEYQAQVTQGTMAPYAINLFSDVYDYNTRIFRFVLDKSRRYVARVASTIAFPYTAPTGQAFNYNIEQKIRAEGGQVTITFKCAPGAEYDDPIIIHEFNQTIIDSNPAMATKSNMVNLRTLAQEKNFNYGFSLLSYMNFKAYPYVDPKTMAFEWWADKAEADKMIKALDILDPKKSSLDEGKDTNGIDSNGKVSSLASKLLDDNRSSTQNPPSVIIA